MSKPSLKTERKALNGARAMVLARDPIIYGKAAVARAAAEALFSPKPTAEERSRSLRLDRRPRVLSAFQRKPKFDF